MMRKQATQTIGLVLCVLMLAFGGAAAGAERIVMRLAHDHTITSPINMSAEFFKNKVEADSGGRMEVQVFPAQQLGSAREMIESMQMGIIEATLLPTARYSVFDQRFNFADMPFLFPNDDVMWAVLDGEAGKLAMSGLPDIGMFGVRFFAQGWKTVTSNRLIKTLDDIQGQRMRTMEVPIIMAQFSAWGANPVPIDFTEVYNSLQLNVVDGQENPIVTVHDMRFFEVQSHMMFLNHAYLSYFLSFGLNWYNSLPADLQEVLLNAALEAAVHQRNLTDAVNAEYLENMRPHIEFVYFTDAEKEQWIEAVQPLRQEFRDFIGGDLLDKVAEEVKLHSN